MTDTEHRKVVIVGSGPAGYTAAIYAAAPELAAAVVAGLHFGGQLMLTTDVENYPGFPEGISGPEMMELFQKQAERFGATVLLEDASFVDLAKPPFRIATAERSFTADAVILPPGPPARGTGLRPGRPLPNRPAPPRGGEPRDGAPPKGDRAAARAASPQPGGPGAPHL